MGIKPIGNGTPPPVVQDNVQSRWGQWQQDLESTGEAGGDALAQIDAKAESAQTTVAQIEAGLTVVEAATGGVGRVEASGPGWSAVRAGSVVMITFDVEWVMSLTAKPVLPDGFKPAQTIYLPVGDGLVTITEDGTVTYPGGGGKATHLYLI